MKIFECLKILIILLCLPEYSLAQSVPAAPDIIIKPHLLLPGQSQPDGVQYAIVLDENNDVEIKIEKMVINLNNNKSDKVLVREGSPYTVAANEFVTILFPEYPKGMQFVISKTIDEQVSLISENFSFRNQKGITISNVDRGNHKCGYENRKNYDDAWKAIESEFGLRKNLQGKTLLIYLSPELENLPSTQQSFLESSTHFWVPICPPVH